MGRRAKAREAWERARQLYRLLLLAPEADGVSARIVAARAGLNTRSAGSSA